MKLYLLAILIITLFLSGCTAEQIKNTDYSEIAVQKSTVLNKSSILPEETILPKQDDETSEINNELETKESQNNLSIEESGINEFELNTTQLPEAWIPRGISIKGKYADADVISLSDGTYRMYYSAEPEVENFEGQVYSATSSDGISWAKENGIIKTWAIFPSVIQLDNGKYRMYFQNAEVIKSAISSDGLTWTDEDGIRIDKSNSQGFTFENVAAPTVMYTGNHYIMVYRGTINERYSQDVPNGNTQLFLWAISEDGINFEKKGIALDSRNQEFNGLVDGPELVDWDGSVRLYFWSYRGIYHVNFENSQFSEPEFDYTTNTQTPFPENPPGDPTLIKINGKWFMYYGQHQYGIYYATLEEQ